MNRTGFILCFDHDKMTLWAVATVCKVIPESSHGIRWKEWKVAYDIRWSPDARDHLRGLVVRRKVAVVEGVEKQLRFQPDQPTQKRKLLRESPLATWELRLGDVRVFYNMNECDKAVEIVAVGIKQHNCLRIGGEEVQL